MDDTRVVSDRHIYYSSSVFFKVDFFKRLKIILCSGNGFKIDYTSSYNGCGGILTGYEGNIYMTPYPDSYKNDEFCTWQIGKPYNLFATS